MRPIERTIPHVATALLSAALLWPAQPTWAQFSDGERIGTRVKFSRKRFAILVALCLPLGACFTQAGPKLVGTGATGNAGQGKDWRGNRWWAKA